MKRARTGIPPCLRRSRAGLARALPVVVLLGCGETVEGSARISIPRGASVRVAAESLAGAGLIRAPRAFSYYAKLTGRDRRVKPGTYLLSAGSSWNELLESLVAGHGLVFTATIPEGWDLAFIVPALARVANVAEDSLTAAVRDSTLRQHLQVPTPTLEGYLFPETYLLPEGSTPGEIVRAMVREFERRWKPEWNARLEALEMTRHEIMTLASIIEREARLAEERPIISGVYHNRLARGMLLQADPTVQYAIGRRAQRVLFRDLTVDSPYNTYRHAGLPPGPIASPGQASIEAALYPADVPWLYFVAHPDGHHEFRRTLREHNQAVQRMRALRRTAEQSARRP